MSKRMVRQRIIGLVFILISALVIALCATGFAYDEASIVLLFIPLGLWLLLTKRVWII